MVGQRAPKGILCPAKPVDPGKNEAMKLMPEQYKNPAEGIDRTKQLRSKKIIDDDVFCHGHPYYPVHGMVLMMTMMKWRLHFVQMAWIENMILTPGMGLIHYMWHPAFGNLRNPGILCCRKPPGWFHNCLMEQLDS
jgi:hypothetical protein